MVDVIFSQDMVDETRAWLEHVHAEQERRPATELFACFTRDLTIQVVNQATQFIQQAFEWRAKGSSEKIDKAQFRKAKCSLYLYYRVLQGMLLEKQRTMPEATQALVDDTDLVKSLLLVAVELVVFAWQEDGMTFPAKTLRLGCMHLAFDMLAATAHFRVHLTPAKGSAASPTALPVAALEYMGFMRVTVLGGALEILVVISAIFIFGVRIIEELALLNGSTFFSLVSELGTDNQDAGSLAVESARQSRMLLAGHVALFENFVQAYATMARERCFMVCTELAASMAALARAEGFEALAQQLLSHLLLEHFHVAFNQHQLNLVSCCVYSAARVLGAAVPFRRINEAIAAVFPLQDAAVFAQADIGVTGEVKLGDTRQLYNDVFLPPMEEHLHSLIAAHKHPGHSTPPAGEAEPALKHFKPPHTPSAGAAPASGQRTPLGVLSASDRNVLRHSTQPR